MFTPLQAAIGPQLALLAIAIVALYAAFRLITAVKPLVINAVVGLIIVFLAGFVGFGVQITPVLLLLVAFGGVPAALLAIVLAQFEIVFEPALLAPLLF
jgi:hypothetical protein